MKLKLTVSTAFLFLVWGLLVGCQSDAPSVEPTETAVSTPQVELGMETAVQATTDPTNTPRLEPSPTTISTPTTTATATAVPTPSFSLTQRKSTLAEIETFLTQSPVLFFYPDRGLELVSLSDYFTENDLTEHTEIFYEDVNGDGESDLILADMFPFLWNNGFVVVSLWDGEQYGTPLVIMDGAKYSPGLRVKFEDWTNDANPEVIFDFKSDTGGTGFLETAWTRYVIHCQTSCNVAWWGITGQLSNYTSIGLVTTITERSLDEEGNPSFAVINESFYAPDVKGYGHISSSQRVFTSTMKTYTWNGTFFDKISENVLEPAYTVTSDSVLSAGSQTYGTATITSELDESDSYRPIFRCTLNLNDKPIGESFECLPDFTKIFWQDITSDGTEELVVLATGLGTQQLLAYEFEEQEATQIANAVGVIIRSDLFGVRLDDIDKDGQLEILTGSGYVTEGSNCKVYENIYPDPAEFCWWYELDLQEQIYKWNGEMFVLKPEE
ncbi:MAG: hypothetical protein IPM53_09815 [Anaerolineaceae bacterium]|nr:hypothetical protein [Anaerolineaceae bacterium]